MPDINDTIKTIGSMPWDGVLKVLLVLGMAAIIGAEYFEDRDDVAEAAQESSHDELQRDLLVSTLTTIESLRSAIQAQEARQDDQIDQLEDELDELTE